MPTIQDLLDHMSEVKDTMSNGLVGQRARDYAANFNHVVKNSLPAITKPNPTVDDLISTGLNVGGLGVIKAWHGSPHIVHKFDNKHYLSGEGTNEAGLANYFTNSKDNANYIYRRLQAKPLTGYLEPFLQENDGKLLNFLKENIKDFPSNGNAYNNFIEDLERRTAIDGDNPLIALNNDFLTKLNLSNVLYYNIYGKVGDDKFKAILDSLYDKSKLAYKNLPEKPTYLYNVGLNIKQKDLLDLNKKVSSYDGNTRNLIDEVSSISGLDNIDKLLARQVFKSASDLDSKAVSDILKKYGVQGAKYKFNTQLPMPDPNAMDYAIYDPSIVSILDRLDFK